MKTMKLFKNIKFVWPFILSVIIFGLSACNEDILFTETDSETEEETVDLTDYADWTDATHGKNAELNYSIVFNQNEVLRFEIKISSENWAIMQSDLSSILGSSGGRPGQGATVSSDPIWVPCSFNFNNTEWYHVGIRYKGNSSLKSTYQSGNKKFSLKLDFDEFEDDYPAIKNQRFYGFKQLNLNNNFDDASLMREKIGADLFRQFGLASAQTAFCVVYIDNGTGPKYYGVYALVEEVDDTVIETQFDNDSGNLYKPDGFAATFANGSFDTSQLELKTNKDSADYSDAKALYDIINSSLRTSNIETWKTNLESVFYVDGFLKWLAANTVIQNWDTYGRMSHNYYLYNNPGNGLLTWIPWDNNEAFNAGNSTRTARSISLDEVNANWPLIRFLMDDPIYQAAYVDNVEVLINGVFNPETITARYQELHELIAPYVVGPNGEIEGYTHLQSGANFNAALDELIQHAESRYQATNAYLESVR